MLRVHFYLFVLCLFGKSFFLLLSAAPIETFYGVIEVEEPVILELIEATLFKRLKFVRMYGVAYYASKYREEYNRYDHSLGVFAILRAKEFSLEEQIAGLLHDVAHTVFSHVGDWIFWTDYHSDVFCNFLAESGLEEILKKHNLSVDKIIFNKERFPALEQELPNLCADRIDYNLQGAYHRGFITRREAQEVLNGLQFLNGQWGSSDKELMKRLARFSLMMTETCWGGVPNFFFSRWLSDAILRGVEIALLSREEILFGTDDAVWDKLIGCNDPFIQDKMIKISQRLISYIVVDPAEADFFIKTKFRGIDPFIISEGVYFRLSAIDPVFSEEYERVRRRVTEGYPIKLCKVVG